jgi:hypothetical protein
MSKKQPEDSVIHYAEHLPPGFVPLGTFCGETGSTPEYGYLDRAFRRGEFKHGRIKFRRKLYAHESDIERCLVQMDKKDQSDALSAVLPDRDWAADIVVALVEIAKTLERLATAAESIATQPKTPQQELLHTINGNGFHS